jgi:hypothetical protein
MSLAALYDLEQETHRLLIREATRLGSSRSALALRVTAEHVGETIEDLERLATKRGLRLGSASAVALDTLRRLRDVIIDDSVRRRQMLLASLREGIDLVRVLYAKATGEGDESLAALCEHWLEVRERLVGDLLARHAPSAGEPALGRSGHADLTFA